MQQWTKTTHIKWEEELWGHIHTYIEYGALQLFHMADADDMDYIIAFDRDTEERRWSVEFHHWYGETKSIERHGDGLLVPFVQGENLSHLAMLSVETGEKRWAITLKSGDLDHNKKPYKVIEGTLYLCVESEEVLRQYDLQTGALKHEQSLPSYAGDVFLVDVRDQTWILETRHFGEGSGSYSHATVHLDDDEPKIWSFAQCKNYYSRCSAQGDALLVCDPIEKELNLELFDLSQRQPPRAHMLTLKQRTVDYDIIDNVLIRPDLAYVLVKYTNSQKHRLYAVDVQGEALLWKRDFPSKQCPSQCILIGEAQDQVMLRIEENYEGTYWIFDHKGEVEETGLKISETYHALPFVNGKLLTYDYDEQESWFYEAKPATDEVATLTIPGPNERHNKLIDLIDGGPQSNKERLAWLQESIAAAQSGDLSIEDLYDVVRRAMGVMHLQDEVKEYISDTLHEDDIPGPLNFHGFAKASQSAGTYHDLFGYGPEDKLFPGFLVATETFGHYFYLDMTIGYVYSAHHDAIFERSFDMTTAYHSPYNIMMLLRWQRARSDYGSLTELGNENTPEDIIQGICTHMPIEPEYLLTYIDDPCFVFLHHLLSDVSVKKIIKGL